MKNLLLTFLSFCIFQVSGYSQLTVHSSDGYDVTIWLEAISLQAPNTCVDDYTFTVNMGYDVEFVGPNAPNKMWTMQGYLLCDQNLSLNFSIRTTGGIGNDETQPDSWNGSNCKVATPQLLGCDQVKLLIEGPGITVEEIYPLSAFVLPIELSRFQANVMGSQGVLLNWETASELNNKHFSVERSVDGRVWYTIAEVKGAGTSSQVQNYDYIDQSPENGISYYRLRQTDYDGTFKYSETQRVNVGSDGADSSLAVYPNPAQNTIYVSSGNKARKSAIGVYNMLGQEVLVVRTAQSYAPSVQSIDVSSLKTGVYFIKSGESVKKFYKN